VNLFEGVEILIENSYNYTNTNTYAELVEISVHDIEIEFHTFHRHDEAIGQAIFNIYRREAV
jgi:hypothetical protein